MRHLKIIWLRIFTRGRRTRPTLIPSKTSEFSVIVPVSQVSILIDKVYKVNIRLLTQLKLRQCGLALFFGLPRRPPDRWLEECEAMSISLAQPVCP